jgi:putative oxidoreductase
MDAGLLLGRVVLGSLMAAHGAQKLFGWFGGQGLSATAGFFAQLGFRPGRLFAAAAGGGEIVAGLLMVLGLFGPLGPALMVTLMIVAAVAVHWGHGLFAMNNGIELPLLYAAGAALLALTGPGSYSVDALVGLTSLWSAELGWAALAIGIAAGVANLGLRRPALPTVAA